MTASPAPFTIREPTPDDLPAIVAIINTEEAKPYTPEAFAQRTQEIRQQCGFFQEWVIENDRDRITGTVRLHSPPLPTQEFGFQLVVAPNARERGYGSALLARVLDSARAQGAERLETEVRETNPASRAWAERRGFSLHFHRFESALDLTTFDEAAHTDLQGRLASADITWQDMDVLGRDEANWTRLYTFFAERDYDSPDMQGEPRLTVEQARHMLRKNPTVQPGGIVLATRGEDWLGMSVMARHPRGAYNYFTGVVPEARGMGVARALKVEVIRRARAAGFTGMFTNNLSVNAPMLAVNRRLGFEPRPGLWVMRRRLS
ncbi:GNAT family N-acetyltransferase [Deinococcus apachensis]|uniref:GNAT family N-acetyltransferase n=1 Tax=Deinococcus apachensis TaxID=309886 RepID=UPI0003683955|nr:GNAT family N-acetyltransferase [Deinococcus apachensis]